METNKSWMPQIFAICNAVLLSLSLSLLQLTLLMLACCHVCVREWEGEWGRYNKFLYNTLDRKERKEIVKLPKRTNRQAGRQADEETERQTGKRCRQGGQKGVGRRAARQPSQAIIIVCSAFSVIEGAFSGRVELTLTLESRNEIKMAATDDARLQRIHTHTRTQTEHNIRSTHTH